MFLDIDGNKVFSLSFGSAPRTFLAHSGWIGNFEDWIATLAPLSETWRAVVYDHRGAGETVVPPENISPESLIDDVFRVMDVMKIDRCVLGGFSRGTVTVMRAVLRHPERFSGLVLMNGAGEVRSPTLPITPRVPPSQWPGADFNARLRWFAERCTPEPNSEHIRRWAQNILARSTAEVADKIMVMEAVEQINWPSRLAELTIPTLIVHGDQDPFYQTETMLYLHSLIPSSRLHIIKGAGHLPAMTRPNEIANLINEYFK